nr:hypothetical protein [Deltaproteobacteria bacterium]
HIHGRLTGFVPAGRVTHTASKISDKYLVSLRVEHLAAHAFDGAFGGTTHLVALSGDMALSPITAAEAHVQLADLVSLYREGQTRPLPVTFDDYATSYLDLAFDGAFTTDPAMGARILGVS